MCDTILASPPSTRAGVMLFGKNSDRRRNEAQAVELIAAGVHEHGSSLRCTYISIPQAPHTSAVLLCRPCWMWGAEMGANEHGVVIGNEALHARSAAPEKEALTGMDLLRLALERASSAMEAIDVITGLLERHGQGGNCGHLTSSFYHNGFMVADRTEAFVLETLDREWVLERVSGVRSISNAYSIGREASQVSKGLLALVHDSGWSSESTPNLAEAIANPNREHIGRAGARRERSTRLLRSLDGELRAADLMNILRDHGDGSPDDLSWCGARPTLCMHAGAEDRPAQTVGSMISELDPRADIHWITGTAAPCISIFKPVFMDVALPDQGPAPTDRFDARAFWWRHERLHRSALQENFARFLQAISSERNAIESEFLARVHSVRQGSRAEREKVVAECWKDASDAEDRWFARLRTGSRPVDAGYVAGWQKMNELAGFGEA